MHNNISVSETPSLSLFAVSCKGVQNISSAYAELTEWAIAESLLDANTQMCTIYKDSFRTTPPNEVRMLAGFISSATKTLPDSIQPITLPGGKHIIGSYTISPEHFGKEWAALFAWMKENGYQWNENSPFEIYHNDFRSHPQGLARVDFYIPIL